MYCAYGNSGWYIHGGPLFGGGPLLGGSVIGGSTVLRIKHSFHDKKVKIIQTSKYYNIVELGIALG